MFYVFDVLLPSGRHWTTERINDYSSALHRARRWEEKGFLCTTILTENTDN